MKSIFTACFILGWLPLLYSQTVALWNFENAASVPAGPIAPSTLGTNISNASADLVGALSSGSPAVCSGAKTWAANFWSTNAELDYGYYYSFSVTANPGYYIDVRYFEFSYLISSSYSPKSYAIGYSVDGGPDYIAFEGTSNNTSYCGSVGVFTGAVSQAGGNVVFKIFFYNQSPAGQTATVRIDNVTMTGGALLLPVEFTQFQGMAHDQGISLHWTTASERQNAHIDIERSFDGTAFKTIGTAAGKGNQDVATQYSFEDPYPFPGINYYRLKQVDKDGSTSFSEVISVASINTYTGGIRVFPNPLEDACTVQLPEHLSGQARLVCLSWQGTPVQSYTLLPDQRVLELDLEDIEPGPYLLFLQDQGTIWRHKILKYK